MATATKRFRLEAYEGLAPDVWATAGIKPGDWVEVTTSEPGLVAIRLAEPTMEAPETVAGGEDLAPYTLDEALALFPIEGPIDEVADAESWLTLAMKDSLKGNDLA